MRNVNEYFKGIYLGIIFRNILWKRKKVINFFTNFYIFLKNSINFFLKNSPLTNA